MKKDIVLRYAVTIIVGFGIMFAVLCAKSIFSVTNLYDRLVVFCDGFFASGALLSCVGLILMCGNRGIFDMLAYGLHLIIAVFRKDPQDRRYKSFADYRKAKTDRKRNVTYLLIVGTGLICVSVVFLILSYRLT